MKTTPPTTPENRPDTPAATTGEIHQFPPAQATPKKPENPHRPTLTAKTEGRELAFAYCESGTIGSDGSSHLMDIFLLGAFIKTREITPDGKSVTATDKDGLRALIERARYLSESMTVCAGLLGKILALTAKELDSDEIADLGWLICGLSEVANEAEFYREVMADELARDFKEGQA